MFLNGMNDTESFVLQSIDNSSFARRKHYTPPEKSKPKKIEPPKEPPAPNKPQPVFVQVSNMKPRDVFVSK